MEFTYKEWKYSASLSHISGLKSLESISHSLTGMTLPEMVFGENSLTFQHIPSGLYFTFNATDALKFCQDASCAPQVAHAETWTKRSAGEFKTFKTDHDWTYTTLYDGTITIKDGEEERTPSFLSSEEGVDFNHLKEKEDILWFQEVHLFEDELHDNGISQLSVKIRVMPSCFYVLMRQWIRVDNVLLRIVDTRFYHHFDSEYLFKEKSISEESFDNIFSLGHPRVLSNYSNPNTFQPLLKQIKFIKEKIQITVKKAHDT